MATPTVQRLMPFMTVEPNGIGAVGDDKWVEIDLAVGCGATATVTSEDTLAGVIDITEGPAMKR